MDQFLDQISLELIKSYFVEECIRYSHSNVRGRLAYFDLDDPNVISFLLGQGCLKCINLFLAEKQFQGGILLYIVRQPEIPLSVVADFFEDNPELFTGDVELPVQELTNSNRLDLLKLFRKMKGDESSIESSAKVARVGMYTRADYLEALFRRDFEMIRKIMEASYDCYGPNSFWHYCSIVKICKKARIWPKDIIMLLLSRMRPEESSELLQLAVKYENDGVLQVVVEKFPLVSNERFKFRFRKEYKIEETYGTVLHFLAKTRKFDLLEKILVAVKESGVVLDFPTLNSICDAVVAGAPLKTIKAFLKVHPDLIQELNTKEDIFLLHSAMDGEQPEVLRYFVEENRLNPQERNAEGLDSILYKIYKNTILKFTPITPVMEMLEYLFPLIYSTDSIYNRNFVDLFAVYTFSTRLGRSNLFNACTETFYGPEVNSMYPFLKRVVEVFGLDSMWNEKLVHGQMILGFIHDPWRFSLKDHLFFRRGYNCAAEPELRRMQETAFNSDEKLELFIALLKHLDAIGFFEGRQNPRLNFGFLDFYIPFEPTLEIVSRIYRVLTRLRKGINLDLSKILNLSFRSAEYCKKYNKYGLIRALYSHYPISSEKWPITISHYSIYYGNYGFDFTDSDRNKAENREIFRQLDELMPVDCLLKHMVSKESPSLKHLCRLKIREVLEEKAAGDSFKFFDSIDALERVPPKMKKYLHFAEHFVDN